MKRKKSNKKPARPRYGEGDLVMVDWIDAAGCNSWISAEAPPLTPWACRTVGWVHGKKAGALALYAEKSKPSDTEVGSIASRNVIPNVCIRKVTVLRKAKAKY
ncbi:hypothetical protein LCGC14_0589670 [marine sediment metagenome]|uniref:Uncharacterized protein n=1 Tax=marine sediment metagenome TaxID=412755 RepID=A0A0F9UM77_9ZZZZ